MQNYVIWNPWFIRIFHFASIWDILNALLISLLVACVLYGGYRLKKFSKKLTVAYAGGISIAVLCSLIYSFSSDSYKLSIYGEALVLYQKKGGSEKHNEIMSTVRNDLNASSVVSKNKQSILDTKLHIDNVIILNYKILGSAYNKGLFEICYLTFSDHSSYDGGTVSSSGTAVIRKDIKVLAPLQIVKDMGLLMESQKQVLGDAMKMIDGESKDANQSILDEINQNKSDAIKDF